MFNFQNLNDYDFELICKDILEKETGITFRTYAKGPDGGVDIKAYINDSIIAQAKHYIGSQVSNLIKSLSNELKKVDKLSPKEYYIFTSRNLSSNKIDEIYEMYKKYMPSKKNIYDGSKLNDLLNQEQYQEIVKKHYKLWLISSNVIDLVLNKNVFIDTEDLMFDIENESKMFVRTSGYHEAFDILSKEHLVILQGNPGVGKTTISKMLVLFYASHGYTVRYASDSSVKDLKKILSSNRDGKEIILLDDFLGQHYLKLKEERPNEIKSLVSFVLRNSNKRLIMNTRITILKEAIRRNQNFRSFIENKDTTLYVIDLDLMSKLEKAKILYNHLFFKNLPINYYTELIEEKKYINIIKHKNYNPRIIEFVTKKVNYNKIISNEYYEYIMKKLNNPLDVWEEEFEERIDHIDRIMLYCLYSLTNTNVDESILKNIFNIWIKNIKADKTKDLFGNSLKRLIESMLRISENNNKRFIGVINPSINDYLYHKISSNEIILDSIIENVIYYEQLLKLSIIKQDKINEYIKKSIINGKFMKLFGLSRTIEYYYLEQIERLNILLPNLNKYIHELILRNDIFNTPNLHFKSMKQNQNLFNTSDNLIIKMLNNHKIRDYYKLTDLLFNIHSLEVILDIIEYDDICSLIRIYEKLFNSEEFDESFSDDFIYHFKLTISNKSSHKIEKNIVYELEDDISELVSELFNDIDNDIKSDYYHDIDDLLEDIIKEGIEDVIIDRVELKKEELGGGFITINSEVDINEILEHFDYMDDIESLIRPDQDDYVDEYRTYNSTSNYSEDAEIDSIFLRDYAN